MTITAFPIHEGTEVEWRAQRERCRQHGFISEGVVFHEELAGPHGMNYFLLPDPGHTQADIKAAATRLYRDQDVVHLYVIWIEPAPTFTGHNETDHDHA